ncbi:MAG TPA: DUF1840 domain-containing protein [Steroidobacter sp.]|jgi:hypothetical protein|nr:DUF1840 domain-containing protein [Steroidobacter sp.]
MLVIFRSKATESVTMFQNVAVELLKLMGATGHVPGGLTAEDVAAALARLEAAIAGVTARTDAPAQGVENDDWASEDDRDPAREPPVAIAVRALPLISLLKRAAAAHAEVIWEGSGK